MGDRKTINKYYPPDFDPSKIAKRRRGPTGSSASSLPTVRLMAPFSMRCTTCGEFIYKGKKFNARKQQTEESYLGIRIFRFYIRCPRCSGEIRFRIEPKIGDYVTEQGAVRNHEPWRAPEEEVETLEQRLDRLEREEGEQEERNELKRKYGIVGAAEKLDSTIKGDPATDLMTELESKVMTTKREMEIEDELDELRARNARIDMAAGGILEQAQQLVGTPNGEQRALADAEDEEAARNAFKRTYDGAILRTSETKPDVKAALVNTSKITKPVIKKKPTVNALGIVVKKKKVKSLV